jgi:tetratricopeptide (TPR) repeat protein
MSGSTEVVFRNEAGQSVSIAEVQRTAGRIRYEVCGGESIPRAAEELHQRARQTGSSGDYQQALDLLEQAVEKAPLWPYPLYDLAFTYLLLKDTDRAIEHYRKTLKIAPRGFFTAITALHTLEREQRGELPAGLYLAYLSIEGMDNRAQKAHITRQLVEQVPSFAPAWKDLAIATDQDTERREAIRKGLAASPDAETKGMLQINEALALDAQGEHETGIRLLETLIRDETSTLATEHLASAALALLSRTAN